MVGGERKAQRTCALARSTMAGLNDSLACGVEAAKYRAVPTYFSYALC